jgi:hypothetical protein
MLDIREPSLVFHTREEIPHQHVLTDRLSHPFSFLGFVLVDWANFNIDLFILLVTITLI